VVLFSAGAGQEALDRLSDGDPDPNGIFTRVLLKEMRKPGVPIRDVLDNVREEVVRLAQGVGRDQMPAMYEQALGLEHFYFYGGSAAVAPTSAAANGDAQMPSPSTPAPSTHAAPTLAPAAIRIPGAPTQANIGDSPDFSGVWKQTNAHAPSPPMRLKITQSGADLTIYISYTDAFGRPFTSAAIQQGIALARMNQGCAPKFQSQGYDYKQPGFITWQYYLTGPKLIVDEEVHWTSPCGGHAIGVELIRKELARMSD